MSVLILQPEIAAAYPTPAIMGAPVWSTASPSRVSAKKAGRGPSVLRVSVPHSPGTSPRAVGAHPDTLRDLQ